ncbi:phage tail protein [Planosporangium sp. 12N6]|uniref:phage tail protein n=1 Tax=Planosporangium spinosum TaxID=3402278 RepID=UPI003CE7DA89
MSRGTIPGLATPYRLADLLPAVYQEEDPFAVRFTAGLDEVLAPILATLDCLDAYVDPMLAPEDFLEWLAGWVGAVLDENAPLPARRAAVASAARLHRARGTLTGLRTLLELLTGGEVEIDDGAGVTWSVRPGAPVPGGPGYRVAIRITVPDASTVSRAAVDAAVTASKPAHVQHSIEVVSR